jgi:hypothetical protein
MTEVPDSNTYYVPLDQLDPELKQLIPAGDKVLYTTRAKIKKAGFGGDQKFGFLAVTDNGLAFRAAKMGFMRAGIISAAKGALSDYVPYSLIYEFHNKKDKIRIKQTLPEDPKKKRGWELQVERCKGQDEDKKIFKQRKNQFGEFIESVYKEAT